MREFLFDWQMNATTWAYLSSLIIIAVYFKFRRFWSVRNLDVVALIALAPGLLLIKNGLAHQCSVGLEEQELGQMLERVGYTWIFSIGGFFLVRLLMDPLMVRRPMLEPNLSAGGLTFTGIALLVFLLSNVITPKPTKSDLEGAKWMDQLLAREDSPQIREHLKEHGPGYPLFFFFSKFSPEPVNPTDKQPEEWQRLLLRAVATRATAVVVYLALVVGVVLIGYRHFDNIHTGMAAASLFLLLPYTSEFTPRLDHVVPAALVVWAIEAYRRPAVAGVFLGLAAGVAYFPLFLLPLWCAFYWRRGLVRFAIGVIAVLLLVTASLLLTSSNLGSFVAQFRQTFGLTGIMMEGLTGFWQYHSAEFRLPVLAAFVAVCGSLALWPAQKNLGTLLSCSAAVMLGAQFWKPFEGGLFMAWYLPLLILTIFRPNLEDRVALSAVPEMRAPWRKGT